MPCFLDLYGGTGTVAAGLILKHNKKTMMVDLRYGPNHDVTEPKVLADPQKRSRQSVLGAMMAPVCTTCSRARYPALRSTEEPMGVKNLNKKEQAQLDGANEVYAQTFRLLDELVGKKTPTSIENPQASIFWHVPMWKRFEKHQWTDHVVDFCQFGIPYRKSTTFRSFYMNPRLFAWKRRCKGSYGRRSVCSRTRKRHVQLRGKHPSGQNWTAIAQPYPEAVGAHLATALVTAADKPEWNAIN